ncbi:MAG: hypothetical protein JWL83_3407, partial [Actinomycetia bacterium]|nr:hypothetical protein [Actinomycetes bacterium]
MTGSDVGGVPFADLPLPDLLPSVPVRRRRSTVRGVVALIGVVALVGVSFVAVSAIGSRGGASSPEAAVRALAHAVDSEDPLAAIDVLAPDEVRTLRNTVSVVERKAAEVKLVNTASKPLAGVDLKVADLALSTEQLAAGYVKVHVTGGVLSAQTHRADFGPALRKLIDRAGTSGSGSCSSSMGGACPPPTTTVDPSGDHAGSVDFAKVRPLDAEPFVVVIRRDGNWYVSPAYTALEYARIANDLPAPDYGSGLA